MKRHTASALNRLLPVSGLALLTLLSGCELKLSLSPSRSPSLSPSPSAAPVSSPVPSASSSPSATPRPSATPGSSPSPSPSPSATPSPASDPGSTGPISCPGFDDTKVLDTAFPGNNQGNFRYYTYDSIFSYSSRGWRNNDAVIVRFVAPAADTYLSIDMTETGGMFSRAITLSTRPCEFESTPNTLYNLVASSLSLSFSSGPSPFVRIHLNPGQTYFLNMANRNQDGSPSCNDNSCDAVILMANPGP